MSLIIAILGMLTTPTDDLSTGDPTPGVCTADQIQENCWNSHIGPVAVCKCPKKKLPDPEPEG